MTDSRRLWENPANLSFFPLFSSVWYHILSYNTIIFPGRTASYDIRLTESLRNDIIFYL